MDQPRTGGTYEFGWAGTQMSEPTLDLRSAVAILRRSRRALVDAALLGAALGIAFTALRPDVYTSTAMILLPASAASADQASSETETQVRIATSAGVLAPAAAAVKPPMSLDTAAEHVQVSAPTFRLLQITATGETPDLAHSLAQSVAESDVAFLANGPSSLKNEQQALVGKRRKHLRASLDAVNDEIKKTTARRDAEDPASPEGRADAAALSQLTAQQANLVLQLDQVDSDASQTSSGGTATATVIQPASRAKPPNFAIQLVGAVFLGVAAAVTIAAIAILLVRRRDRRLHSRDDFADAVGSPVVASIQSRAPQNVAGWRALLADYDPGDVDAWALRQALRQLVFGESAIPRGHGDAGAATGQPVSITVVTLSDDIRGLAIGPRIASYAASVGVRTQLVAAQPHASAAGLWAACSRQPSDEEVRPGLFVRVRPWADQKSQPAIAEEHHVDLTVVLAVLDRSEPRLREVPQTSVTVLALSPASATPEELAQAAVTADDAGRRIAGIIVADPDSSDRTTGRLLQHERNQQVPLPIRLTGMSGPTPSANVSRPSRRPR